MRSVTMAPFLTKLIVIFSVHPPRNKREANFGGNSQLRAENIYVRVVGWLKTLRSIKLSSMQLLCFKIWFYFPRLAQQN